MPILPQSTPINIPFFASCHQLTQRFSQAGLVTIKVPSAYNLAPNSDVIPGQQNIYWPSAFHQLHCLRYLQTMHVQLRDNSTENRQGFQKDALKVEDCFDYLRQGAACGGDLVLEIQPGNVKAKNTKKEEHVCRDWTQVSLWQEKRSIQLESDAFF